MKNAPRTEPAGQNQTEGEPFGFLRFAARDRELTDRLRQRITALQASIAAAERKRHGIDAAITSRRAALNRLLAASALRGSGGAPSPDA